MCGGADEQYPRNLTMWPYSVVAEVLSAGSVDHIQHSSTFRGELRRSSLPEPVTLGSPALLAMSALKQGVCKGTDGGGRRVDDRRKTQKNRCATTGYAAIGV